MQSDKREPVKPAGSKIVKYFNTLNNTTLKTSRINILLADDDTDDCFFFEKALREIPIATQLTILNDGEQLMEYLSSTEMQHPLVIFLDLSMPRKTGFECLQEIKENNRLKNIEVIVLSTSYPRDVVYEQGIIKTLTGLGAANFIRKPGDFSKIKEVIHNELIRVLEKKAA